MSTKPTSGASGLLNHPVVVNARTGLNNQVKTLDTELSKYPTLVQLEAQTKVPKAYSFIAASSLFFVAIFFNIFGLAVPISNIVGFALPAYWSIQALESPGDNDDKQWLTYWVTFSSFTIIESLFLRLVLYYFPSYFLFKTVFITYLQLPQFRGAEVVYTHILKPVIDKTKENRKSANSVTPTATEHDKTL